MEAVSEQADVDGESAATTGAAVRLAFVGKGGAGKSSLAGTFCRLLGRRTGRVLLLDSDPMPGLALSLGIAPSEDGVPEEAVREGPEGGRRYVLRDDWHPEALIERSAIRAPDGVHLLQAGKSEGGGLSQASLHAYQGLLDALVPGSAPSHDAGLQVHLGERPSSLTDWPVVADLPGGTRQPFMGWGRFATRFLVVVEPSAKSVLAARRLRHLATGWSHGRSFEVVAVANKTREAGDADWVAEHTGLPVIAAVPWDEQVAAAERFGRAPLDHAPDSPAVQAVAALVEHCLQHEEEQP